MFKPIITLTAAAALALSANAFTINPPEYINTPEGSISFIFDPEVLPTAYSYNMQAQLYTNHYIEGSEHEYVIYNHNLKEIKRLRINHNPTMPIDGKIGYNYADYTNLTDSNPHTKSLHFTQTLFNSDEHYEYIVPMHESQPIEIPYEDPIYPIYGFKIVSTNGNVLASVEYPDDLRQSANFSYTTVPDIYVSENNIVIVMSTIKKSDISSYTPMPTYLAYNIDRSELGSTIQPKLTNRISGVSPTLITNNEPINIELGDIDTNCRIDIFNTNGAIVYSTTVTSGTSHITVPTYTLPRGVNIVHISDGNSINKSTKVVVR